MSITTPGLIENGLKQNLLGKFDAETKSVEQVHARSMQVNIQDAGQYADRALKAGLGITFLPPGEELVVKDVITIQPIEGQVIATLKGNDDDVANFRQQIASPQEN